MKKLKNNSGIAIVIVLWIVAIISLFAVSIGRRAQIELALTKNHIKKLKTKGLAYAGVIYAINQMRLDLHDPDGKTFDNEYLCGFSLDDKTSREDIFKNVLTENGGFDIVFEGFTDVSSDGLPYGFGDEERKINVNALQSTNYKVLTYLLMQFGYEESLSDMISASAIDWMDSDDNPFSDTLGAESEYYSSLPKPYLCKNQFFDNVEELKSLRGMTDDIYNKIRDFITVHPKNGVFKLNFDTAPPEVLRAVARTFAGPRTNTEITDADSLVEKMIVYRRGGDQIGGTEDDVVIDMNDMGLNAKERTIFLQMNPLRTKVSHYLRFISIGKIPDSPIRSSIEIIINRENMSVAYWNRDGIVRKIQSDPEELREPILPEPEGLFSSSWFNSPEEESTPPFLQPERAPISGGTPLQLPFLPPEQQPVQIPEVEEEQTTPPGVQPTPPEEDSQDELPPFLRNRPQEESPSTPSDGGSNALPPFLRNQ